MLFGSYRINERKDAVPRLQLHFGDGSELNFYACSIKEIGADLDAEYDWRGDVMNEHWDAALARKKLRAAFNPLGNNARFANSGSLRVGAHT